MAMQKAQKRIIEMIACLDSELRDADRKTLQGVLDDLQKFNDSWLKAGTDTNLSPRYTACLSSVDVTQPLAEVVENLIEYVE